MTVGHVSGMSQAQRLKAKREVLARLRQEYKRTVFGGYQVRPMRANEGRHLCSFYQEKLSNQSRFQFHYLMSAGDRDVADALKCGQIAAAAAEPVCGCESACAGRGDEEQLPCEPRSTRGDDMSALRFDLVLSPRGEAGKTGQEEEGDSRERDSIDGWAFFYVPDEAGDTSEPSIGIAIADAMQGQGLGKKMMHALISAAQAAPFVRALRLNVLEANGRAVALYETCGFERLSTWCHDDHTHPFLTANDTVLQMRLPLQPAAIAVETAPAPQADATHLSWRQTQTRDPTP
jgi:GNAT superfamily N-acetyltransferase